MIDTLTKKSEMKNYLDTYYPDNEKLSGIASEILALIGNDQAQEAKNRWDELRGTGQIEKNDKLIESIILAELGKREAAAALLWREMDNNPESFIRALHWLMFTMENEINENEEIHDAERFLERICDNWGEDDIRSLALRSNFALFVSDYPVFLEYLQKITEKSENGKNRYWAYFRAAESVEADLPADLRKNYTDFLKDAHKSFPVDDFFYHSMIKSLFIESDSKSLMKLAEAELNAGHLERLPELIRGILATVMMQENNSIKARTLLGNSFREGDDLSRLFILAIDLNVKLLECVPSPRIEQLADLEILCGEITRTITILQNDDSGTALTNKVVLHFAAIVETVQKRLLD